MSTPHLPLPTDAVVELLSAELDGEFSAAAADLGLDPAEARARLAATPGVDEHRGALAAARASLAVAPLPAERRAELVAAALTGAPADEVTARRARASRWVATSAAAAVAVVLLVVAAIATGGDDDVDTASGDAARLDQEAAEEFAAGDDTGGDGDGGSDDGGAVPDDAAEAPGSASPPAPDFGEVGDPDLLRARLAQIATTTADSGAALGEGGDGSAAQRFVDDSCLADQAAAYALATPPLVRAVATFDGAPAEVIVFEDAGTYTAIVLGAGCEVLADEVLRPDP